MKHIKYLPFVIIIIIPLMLVITWFKDGNILGTGESGLPFYDLNLQYNINKDAWANYALGHPLNIGAAAAPTYLFFAQLQNLGIPAVFLQGFFLWLILAVSGFAVYKLVRELFPDIEETHVLLGVLFYWFNPFSLVNVWNRFLNNFFVFYALFPLALYFFIKGLRSRKYIYAILIGLVSAMFSYALTSVAFNLLFWGTILYLSLFFFLTHKQDRIFTVNFFLLTISFWVLTNFWWISQVFSYLYSGSFDAVTSTSFKTDSNYNTFYLISQRLGILTYIFRLKHASFFESINDLRWVGIYQFPILILIEFLIIGIVLIPLILKKRNVYVLMFGGAFFISIFLAKGNNPPLGEVFDKLFLNFSFLQIFRNPFEKLGFVLSLSASILFAIGSYVVGNRLSFRWKKMFHLSLFCWVVFVWGFPFWTSFVFTNVEPPRDKMEIGYQVRAPNTYKEASDWLTSQKESFRLAVFPIREEGITYLWDKGYSGVELSNQLLPKTSVSFNTNIPYYDSISNNLERIFLTRENFSKIMDVLNSKFILLREDIDWKIRQMRDPASIEERIKKNAATIGLKKVKNLDKLSFWEYTGWQDKSIYLTNSLIKSKQIATLEDLLNVESDQDFALYNSADLLDDQLKKTEIIHPDFRFGLGSRDVQQSPLLRGDIIFPTIRILPSEPLYPFILIKENLEFMKVIDPYFKLIKKISLLGKRLVEVEREASLGDFEGAIKAIDDYNQQLKELYAYPLKDDPHREDSIFVQQDLYKLFSLHFEKIEGLIDNFPEDKKEKIIILRNSLKEFVINKGIEPIFGYIQKDSYPIKDRIIYQFNIEKEGSYELLFNIRNWNDYFSQSFDKPFLLQVDNNLILRSGELKENGISFGVVDLNAGKHEIGWNALESINLIDAPSEFLMEVDHGVIERSFPINKFDPYASYFLSLDYFFKKGTGVLVSIEGNNDSIKKGVVQRQYQKHLNPNNYDYDLKTHKAYYLPAKTTDNAQMIFSISPWNNCHEIYWSKGQERCGDEAFRRSYDRTTQVVLSNVSLVKLMTEAPFLRLVEQELPKKELPKITFDKINNAEYKVSIKGAKEKYALILSELFDPGWKLFEQDGKELRTNHFLANAYANGWVIDKKGDYQLQIKFIPQDLLEKGQKVSIVASILGFGLIFFSRKKGIKK